MNFVSSAAIAFPEQSTSASLTDTTIPGARLPRVALFSGNYNYVRDGANRTLNRLVAHLLRRGVPVRVYAPTVCEPAFPATGDLISVPSMPIPGRSEYRLALGLTKSVRADLEAFGPTLIHLSSPDFTGLAAQRFARARGIPMVASYHTRFESYLRYYGLQCLEGAASQILRAFYRPCRHLYVPTDNLAQALRTDGFNSDVRVWSRGIDREMFTPTRRDPVWRTAMGIPSDQMAICFVGRLVREKGLDLLVRVAEGLAQLGVPHRLLIVGEGPERAWLAARIPNAIFTGHLDGRDLERAYASADVFLNPSTTESFGNVTLEAMASGLSVVCARDSASASIVRDGVSGYLLDPTRPAGFVAALARLAISAALRRDMGAAGRAESAAFSWDAVMDGLLANYCEATAVPPDTRRNASVRAVSHHLSVGEATT